jgi:hypothetical protein
MDLAHAAPAGRGSLEARRMFTDRTGDLSARSGVPEAGAARWVASRTRLVMYTVPAENPAFR